VAHAQREHLWFVRRRQAGHHLGHPQPGEAGHTTQIGAAGLTRLGRQESKPTHTIKAHKQEVNSIAFNPGK
jgi:hypothetical protein